MFIQIGDKAPEPYDWLHKLAEVITALMPAVWPAVVIIVAFLFKDPISDFIRRIKHFEAPGFKGDALERGLEKVEDKALDASAKASKDSTIASDAPYDTNLPVVVGPNPFETILKAWAQVEQEIAHLSEVAKGPPSGTPVRQLSWLARAGFLDETDIEALNELRRFRNSVVHQPNQVVITPDQAARYAESANILASRLQNKTREVVIPTDSKTLRK